MTVEVVSNKLELYRISKVDLLYYFDLSSKSIETIKGIDNTQQINMLLKMKIIEDFACSDNWSELSLLDYIESNPIISTIPEIVRESNGLNILQDALKSQDTSTNTKKLEDLKSKLQVTNLPQTAVDSQGALNKLKSINNSDLSKNIALGTQKLQPKTINRLGLSESQLVSKNKLDALTSIKKSQPSEEEVSFAFKRINELKKGEGGVSKLLQGIEIKNESVSFTQLSDKLNNKSNKDIVQLIKEEPIKEKPKEDDFIMQQVHKKESKEHLDLISSLDQKQLFKRTDSIREKKSDRHLPEVN